VKEKTLEGFFLKPMIVIECLKKEMNGILSEDWGKKSQEGGINGVYFSTLRSIITVYYYL